MTATEKHFPPYIDSENTDADTQGNAESWITPDRALRYKGSISNGASLFVEHGFNGFIRNYEQKNYKDNG